MGASPLGATSPQEEAWPVHLPHSKVQSRGFPGGPVVNTLPSNARGMGSIPGWGAKIPHVLWPKKQNIKQKS